MQHQSINVTQARDNLSKILGRVRHGREVVTIEKKGKPFAVIINPEQYEALQKEARRRFGEIAADIASRNTQYKADEVKVDVTNEVEAVRQELYERSEPYPGPGQDRRHVAEAPASKNHAPLRLKLVVVSSVIVASRNASQGEVVAICSSSRSDYCLPLIG